MRAVGRGSAMVWAGAFIGLAGLIVWHRSTRMSFNDPDFATGYALFALIVFLALYNGRKRLSMIPLGRASTWLTLHLVGGALSMALFWLHTGNLWPLAPLIRPWQLCFMSCACRESLGIFCSSGSRDA